MQYIAYGQERPAAVKVMLDAAAGIAHIRMARNYQPPDPQDDQSAGQWDETYQQIGMTEAPTPEQVAENESAWWERGAAWEEPKEATVEQRIQALETENAELREVIDALLGGDGQ